MIIRGRSIRAEPVPPAFVTPVTTAPSFSSLLCSHATAPGPAPPISIDPGLVPKRLLLLAFILVGCSRAPSREIVLGAAGPWDQPYGRMNRMGIELAVDQINAQPDWRQHPLRVIFRDDAGDGVRATTTAQEFLDSAEVLAVIGHVNSGAMVAAARVYDRGLPAVATTASTPALTGISPWTFRVISSDSMNGLTIGRFMAEKGDRRAAILYENNTYGRGLADAFRRGFGGDVVSMDPVAEGGKQDFEPYVTWFKRRPPDVVFVAGTGESGEAFLREARRQRLAVDFAGGDGWTVLASDTALAEGIYVGAPFSAQDTRPEAQRFVADFESRYHQTPDGNAALAFDATKLLARAALAAGSRQGIRDYLAHLTAGTAFPGVTGNIYFASSGDPLGKSIVMTRVHRGALLVEDAR